MTLTLLVGFGDLGLTAGGSTSLGKPLPFPFTVLSTQSPTGMAGPVYGNRVSTSRASISVGAASIVAKSAARNADAVVVFILDRFRTVLGDLACGMNTAEAEKKTLSNMYLVRSQSFRNSAPQHAAA